MTHDAYLQHCDVTCHNLDVTSGGNADQDLDVFLASLCDSRLSNSHFFPILDLFAMDFWRSAGFCHEKRCLHIGTLTFLITSSRSHFPDSGIRNNVWYRVCYQAYFQDRKCEFTPGDWLVHDYSAVGHEWDFEMVGILSGWVVIQPAVFVVISYFLFSFFTWKLDWGAVSLGSIDLILVAVAISPSALSKTSG